MIKFAKNCSKMFKILLGILLVFAVIWSFIFSRIVHRKIYIDFNSQLIISESSLITEYRYIIETGDGNIEKFKNKLMLFAPEIKSNMFKAFYCVFLMNDLTKLTPISNNGKFSHFSVEFKSNNVGILESQLESFKRTDPNNALPFILSTTFQIMKKDFKKANEEMNFTVSLKSFNDYTLEQNQEVVKFLIKALDTTENDLKVYSFSQYTNLFPFKMITANALKYQMPNEILDNEVLNADNYLNHIGQQIVKEAKYPYQLIEGKFLLSDKKLGETLTLNWDKLAQNFSKSHGKIYWFFNEISFKKDCIKYGDIEAVKRFTTVVNDK